MMDEQDNISFVEPENSENIKDPKTGKTISRKRAIVMTAGAMAAGSVLNDYSQAPGIAEIILDNNGDGIGDSVLTDENNDGLYETAPVPSVETSSDSGTAGQAWNPNTAPVAGPGLVDDDMSFSEAFASAREEMGAGGVFAWHGQYYNTFYAEELDDNNQPVVEYAVTEPHDLDPVDYNDPVIPGDAPAPQESPDENAGDSPNIMAADFDVNGGVDAVFVDLNQDGSADGAYTDANQDGQITEDEYVPIHDPANLAAPEAPADPSMMSVDTNADGVDDMLLSDVEGDQVADVVGIDANQDMQIDESEVTFLNPDLMGGSEENAAPVEYDGEISTDMPEDVSEDVIDGMTGDVAALEDNFDEINNWS